MKNVNRRRFLGGALTSAVLLPEALAQLPASHTAAGATSSTHAHEASTSASKHATGHESGAIDFRYAPILQQTSICFPDDPHKTLINQSGDLLYEYQESYFHLKYSFALCGMQPAKVTSQQLESPSIPVVTTVLEYADATMTLTTFATNNPDEGRVDNVLIEVRPRPAQPINVAPIVLIQNPQICELKIVGKNLIVSKEKSDEVRFVGKVFDNPSEAKLRGSNFALEIGTNQQLTLHQGVATSAHPYRAFLRFPLGGPAQAEKMNKIIDGLDAPDEQLAATRTFWTNWSPFFGAVSMNVPGKEGEFITACARNIMQAREVINGKLTFQVGATCYQGLWVVDGNFILEAARYLGYDKEATEGLRTTWSKQLPSGQIVAGGGPEFYKGTAIAMFTLARQCELSQNWSLLDEMVPNVVAAIEYLDLLRAKARSEGGTAGKYGLLPKGFADGGLDGHRDEFTNTLWAMAGLKAIGAAGEQQQLPKVAAATKLYKELYVAFNEAAREEMRSYEGKFQYLPMLMKDDPDWNLPDAWDRPRPQSAQWALSHTIFPGRVFDPTHPVVKGHVALMQAVQREGIPAETGWSHHEAVWTYNAPFVAQVYLWLGMKQAAHDTFIGFLNHASPHYCWREEQPLQSALVGSYVGDMPHNWASAECIRYIRHIFALEDGPNLRLLAGITEGELAAGNPYTFKATPTRFGRLDLNLEPLDKQQGWRLTFQRSDAADPASISVPATLAGKFHLASDTQMPMQRLGENMMLDPTLRKWSLTWKI